MLCLWSSCLYLQKEKAPYCPLDIYKSPEHGSAHVFATFIFFFYFNIRARTRKTCDQEAHQKGLAAVWPFPRWNLLMREECLQSDAPVTCQVVHLSALRSDNIRSVFQRGFETLICPSLADRLHLVLMLLPSTDQWKRSSHPSPSRSYKLASFYCFSQGELLRPSEEKSI